MEYKISKNERQIFQMLQKTSALVLFFSVSVVIVSPLVGTVFEFLNLRWGWFSVTLTVVLSIFIAVRMRNDDVFAIDDWKEFLVFLGLIATALLIYLQYSPTLEIRQDPSVYMLKALNLVNYGHLYSPMTTTEQLVEQGILSINDLTGYATIQNGTEFVSGNLYTDFYPGGAFCYALIGMFSKKFIFLGQTLIMLGNVILLYFVLKKLAFQQLAISKAILAATFFIAPIIVWFGRGSFSEPFALFFVLLLINFLLHKTIPIWLIALAFCSSYSSRIDYLLVLILGVFIITFLSKKAGIIYSILICVEVLIFKSVYFIYYDRITTQDMPILKYGIVMIALMLIVSLIIASYGKKWIQQIYYSKAIKILIAAIGMVCTLLMFRDNIISPANYEYAEIHGQFIRTYVEEILDLLFQVFPSFILVTGLLGLVYFICEKKICFTASVFMLGISIVYLYFLLAAGNSPQLYWMLRRYYNVVLPMAFVAFVLLISSLQKKTVLLISIVGFLASANMFFNSRQVPDYRGLDQSVVQADSVLEKEDIRIVFYDEKLRYEVSSIMAFNSAEFIPVDVENESKIGDIENWIEKNGITNIAWILDEKYTDESDELKLTYQKMGEEYGAIPKEVYYNEYNLYLYSMDEVRKLRENTTSIIYPNIRIEDSDGFYADGEWMNGDLKIRTSDISTEKYTKLIIQMYDYEQYYLDNNDMENLDLILYINGIPLRPESIKGENIIFDISELNTSVEDVEIKCNTFNSKQLGIGEDDRDLGIAIERIYME